MSGTSGGRPARPEQVDLTASRHPWQEVPMPGANLGFHLTRLASRSGTFVVHGHFPPGFAREVAGGYLVAEEFVVLDGELHLGDAVYRRGDLTYIPAGAVRTRMSAPEGATVLAWFGGPAVFHPADQLPAGAASVAETVHLGPDVALPDLPGASWTRGDRVAAGSAGDVVSADLSIWRRLSAAAPPHPDDYVRVEK